MDWFIDHFVVEEDRESMRSRVSIENLLKYANEHQIYRVNFRLRREDDQIRYCQVGYARTKDQRGNVHFAAGFHNIDDDVRRQIQQAQDLEHAWKNAHIDQMTGMLNRRSYEEKLQELRDDQNDIISLVYMDLNGLKTVNDNLGHHEGDNLIKGAASVIRGVFADRGFCYRTGGDEFVAILVNQDDTEEELRAAIQAGAAAWKGNFSEGLTISFGMATSTMENFITIADLMKQADDAMYSDKRAFYSTRGNDRRRRRG